jgi:hypothetical protein
MQTRKLLRAAVAVGVAAAGSAALYASPAGAAKIDSPALPTATVANNTLTIVGTPGDDNINVSLDPNDPNQLLVNLTSDGANQVAFDRSTFTAITVFLRDGDDSFSEGNATITGSLVGSAPTPDEQLTVFGGEGNDRISGGDGNDLLFGEGGNDTIFGNGGDDVIFGGGGDDNVNGGKGHDTAFLNGGDDSFVWNPGDGSDTIDGGNGTDTMVFNGAAANEKMSLSANGDAAVFLRDVANIRMDLNRVERVAVNALGGTDSIHIGDMRGTDVREADVNLAGPDGGDDLAADTVTVDGSDHADNVRVSADSGTVAVDGLHTATNITGSGSFDQLQVNTLGGNDRVDVGNNVTNLIGVGVDLGADQH